MASPSPVAERLVHASRTLAERVDALRFAPPVACVYDPLVYAWEPHAAYLRRYGAGPKEVLLVGMNPGPFGMVQTGVPFGDVAMVRDWLGITGTVHPPREVHPRRPVRGFDEPRAEVSGTRLWGWARARSATAARFFERFFVWNYCPLAFLEASGRNRTPDKLPAAERAPLYAACDDALREVFDALAPAVVVGIGAFALGRVRAALDGRLEGRRVGSILHPSPASPRANRGWQEAVDAALEGLGVRQEAAAAPPDAR